MIKTLEQAKELANEYNFIDNDWDRLHFLKDHNQELMAILDNDCTMVEFQIDDNVDNEVSELISDIDLNSFDDYHYWSDGCLLLFKFAGICAESC